MGRERKTPSGKPINLGIRAPDELIKALDAEAEMMSAEKKGLDISRSKLAIVLLWEALEARQKARAKK